MIGKINTRGDTGAPRQACAVRTASPSAEWPRKFEDLPVLMTQAQVAQLFGLSERTLERQRHKGDGIRFCKMGRRVFYRRDDVVHHLLNCSFDNTAEARAARGVR